MENIKRYEIAHRDYDINLCNATIYRFEEETGKEFFPVAYAAMEAWSKMGEIENTFERAKYMTHHVSIKDAAALFYWGARLAEKEKHYVTKEEMQDACLYESGVPIEIDGKATQSYPILFANMCAELLNQLRKKKATE